MQQAFANAQSMYTRLMIFTNGIETVKLFSSTSHFNLMFRYHIELFCAINRARFSTGITLTRVHISAWQNTLTILLLLHIYVNTNSDLFYLLLARGKWFPSQKSRPLLYILIGSLNVLLLIYTHMATSKEHDTLLSA